MNGDVKCASEAEAELGLGLDGDAIVEGTDGVGESSRVKDLPGGGKDAHDVSNRGLGAFDRAEYEGRAAVVDGGVRHGVSDNLAGQGVVCQPIGMDCDDLLREVGVQVTGGPFVVGQGRL